MAAVEDLVYILDVVGVGLDAEIHESNFEFEKLAHGHGLALVLDYLVSIFFEQSENVQVLVDVGYAAVG